MNLLLLIPERDQVLSWREVLLSIVASPQRLDLSDVPGVGFLIPTNAGPMDVFTQVLASFIGELLKSRVVCLGAVVGV